MMTVTKGLPSGLIVPSESFSRVRLIQQARDLGYAQPNTLEALIWDYELFAQIQRRTSKFCRLKGGAAVQLYVPAERQRASVDIDVLTTMSKEEVQQLLRDIAGAYGADAPYLRFDPYVPNEPTLIEGLHSYTTLAPSALGQEWRLQDGGVVGGRMIKVDIHRTAQLPPGVYRDGLVAGMSVGYRPVCAPRAYLVAEKMLTQARRTVGVPDDRYQDLPKHLYDLHSLLLSAEVVQCLEEASEWLPMLIEEQGEQWRGDVGINNVLDDLEASLLEMAIIDYGDEREEYDNAVRRLETLYLPRASRMRLHQWAKMAARSLAMVRLLKLRIGGRERIVEDLLPTAEFLAGQVKDHPQASKLTKALCRRLSPSLQRLRQLRGSPPERVFWILLTWDNLAQLADIVSSPSE